MTTTGARRRADALTLAPALVLTAVGSVLIALGRRLAR